MSDIISDYAIRFYFTEDGLCSLCGQSGIVDTRGIVSPGGVACGRLNFCICPNGQALRKGYASPGDVIGRRVVLDIKVF